MNERTFGSLALGELKESSGLGQKRSLMNSVCASSGSRTRLSHMATSVLQKSERLLKLRSGDVCISWGSQVRMVQMEWSLLQEDGR